MYCDYGKQLSLLIPQNLNMKSVTAVTLLSLCISIGLIFLHSLPYWAISKQTSTTTWYIYWVKTFVRLVLETSETNKIMVEFWQSLPLGITVPSLLSYRRRIHSSNTGYWKAISPLRSIVYFPCVLHVLHFMIYLFESYGEINLNK